jgi:hypothetical protein
MARCDDSLCISIWIICCCYQCKKFSNAGENSETCMSWSWMFCCRIVTWSLSSWICCSCQYCLGALNFENHIYVLDLLGFSYTISISVFLFVIIYVLSMSDSPESLLIVLLFLWSREVTTDWWLQRHRNFFVQSQLMGSSTYIVMNEAVIIWSLYCVLCYLKYNLRDMNEILKKAGCVRSFGSLDNPDTVWN